MIALLAVFAFLLVAVIAVNAIAAGLQTSEKPNPPDILEGEDIYLNKPIAYPSIEEKNILSLLVINENGSFDLTRYPGEADEFWLSYDNGNGVKDMLLYAPPIVDAEGDIEYFDYESLYAIEQNDGYGRIYLLTYLCSAIGAPYFDERIELPEEKGEERDALLLEYGFNNKSEYIAFAYNELAEDGKTYVEKSHSIRIGDRALSGNGFYFMVDDRNCIYYTGSNYLEYALQGFHTFVKGMLVAGAASGDGVFEPYLTTDYKQWASEMHKAEGDAIVEKSEVITYADVYRPFDADEHEPDVAYPSDGYDYTENGEAKFDLSALVSHPDFERIKNTLVGKLVGTYYDDDDEGASPDDRILLTLLDELYASGSKLIDFGDKDSVTYTYSITAIESVINKNGESASEGTPVGDSEYLKVSYSYSIDGTAAKHPVYHAVISLSDANIPSDTVDALRAMTVGKLDTPLTFDIAYTKDVALKSNEKLVISAIVGIYNEKGLSQSKVTKTSYVDYRYYEVLDGTKTRVMKRTVSMADLESTDPLYKALIGRERENKLTLQVSSEDYYYESMRSFTTYAINEIKGFVTYELISAFRFQNAKDRDPFYGESIYENSLTDSKYSLYGMSYEMCKQVALILGGVGEDTTQAGGLSGETVAVGLTHELMEKYGLYKHKIYFELPREIFDDSDENKTDDKMSDYAWRSTLGFTLYISDADPETGERYIGSDMFNLIARVDGKNFVFLDYSFVDMWARRSMFLVDYDNVGELGVEFFMEDVYGSYDFDLSEKTYYEGLWNGEPTRSETYFDGSKPVEYVFVKIAMSGECSETELSKLFDELKVKGEDGVYRVSVTALYNKLHSKDGKPVLAPGSTKETLGVYSFLEAYETLQNIIYAGTLTPEEQKKGFEDGNLVMRLKLLTKGDNSSSLYYYYDFYRIDNGRVMVSLYQTDGETKTTAVSDFYISTFAFKKLVNVYLGLFNGQEIDCETGYVDEKKDS